MDSKTYFDIKYFKFNQSDDYLVDTWLVKKRTFPTKLFALCAILLITFTTSFLLWKNNERFTQGKDTKIATIESDTNTQKPPALGENNNIATYGLVLKNDSYWKLAKRYCGSGRAYLNLKPANNGKALQPGDTVLISC